MNHIVFRPLSPNDTPTVGAWCVHTDGRMSWRGERTTGFAREAPNSDLDRATATTDATPPVVGMVLIRTCLPTLPRSRGAGTKERP